MKQSFMFNSQGNFFFFQPGRIQKRVTKGRFMSSSKERDNGHQQTEQEIGDSPKFQGNLFPYIVL